MRFDSNDPRALRCVIGIIMAKAGLRSVDITQRDLDLITGTILSETFDADTNTLTFSFPEPPAIKPLT